MLGLSPKPDCQIKKHSAKTYRQNISPWYGTLGISNITPMKKYYIVGTFVKYNFVALDLVLGPRPHTFTLRKQAARVT